MTAVPLGPIDEPPTSLRVRMEDIAAGVVPSRVRRDALLHALRGVELGAYDEAVITWLADAGDAPSVATLVSLVERARRAGGGGW